MSWFRKSAAPAAVGPGTAPKPAELRRRRARAARKERVKRWRRRALLLLLSTGVLGVIWHSGVLQYAAARMDAAFDRDTAMRGMVIRNLLVQGRVNIDPATLRETLKVKPGDPLLDFNPRAAQNALTQISWVRAVQVERRLPDTVYIRLTERAPFALWQDHGKLHLIDRDGVSLTDANLQKFSDLPMVAGADAPAHAGELIDLLRAEPTLMAQVDTANWVSDRRWDLLLKNGVIVQLPPGDAGLAIQQLVAAKGNGALKDENITVIDLRESGRMTVRKKAGSAGQ